MTLEDATRDLRTRLARLAREAEDDPVLAAYPPRFGRLRLSPYRRLRVAAGDLLRGLGLRAKPPVKPWRPGLRHAAGTETARPLVVWALETDRETLRRACAAVKHIESELLPQLVPVLVTDVADFAFFSRLGWLIEYVPTLSAPAGGYAARKTRYLAWRYRDAAVLPASPDLVDLSTERVLASIGRAALEDPTPT